MSNLPIIVSVSSIIFISFIISCRQGEVQVLDHSQRQESSETGIAARYPGDRDIEEHTSVIFASGFEKGLQQWSEYDTAVSTIRTESSLAHGGSKSLQITATRDIDTGGEVSFKFSKGVDELYLRFYTKFDENTVMPHHFVKIRAFKPDPYWGNAGRRPEGDEAFWTGIEPTLNRVWNFYTYWYKMHSWQTVEGLPDSSRGPNPYYGNVFKPAGQTPLKRNQWICVEAYIKANTPGKPDGEMAFWINGVKQGEWKPGIPEGTWSADKFVTTGEFNTDPQPFEGFEFRSDSTVKINEISLQWYVSDEYSAKGEADKNIVYFDDVVAATQYIGPRVNNLKK